MLDKRRVRASFERAAASYDQVAVLQREVGRRLLERLDYIRCRPRRVLDVGAGTGHTTTALARRYPRAQVVALDLAPAMLQRARGRTGLLTRWRGRAGFVGGDAEALPLATQSVDLIFSNLTLQWCNGPDRAFAEFRRVLKPDGLLMFSTLGPDTLRELRAAWAAVDAVPHVNVFLDMHDVGDAMMRTPFAEPVMDAERFTLTYSDVRAVMADLKALGARNANSGRPRGLTGRRALDRLAEAYEVFRTDGRLPATFEVVYGHGWGVEAANIREAGTVKVPLSQLRR